MSYLPQTQVLPQYGQQKPVNLTSLVVVLKLRGRDKGFESIGMNCLLYMTSNILGRYALCDYRERCPWFRVSCRCLTVQVVIKKYMAFRFSMGKGKYVK